MNSFATENRLLTLFDIPVNSPEVSLQPLTWLAIATVSLPQGSRLDLLWLTISVPSNALPLGVTAAFPTPKVNPDFGPGGLVTAYLIRDWSPDLVPWLQTTTAFLACPAQNPAIAVLPFSASLPGQAITVTAAGNYTVVLCNNSTNLAYCASVCGALTIDTDPAA